METEVFSEEQREKQFAKLQEAQGHVLNLTHWHDFLGILKQSGFMGENMISSQTTVYYTYILYLIGRTDLKVKPATLGQVIGRWYFMASITSRYTGGSPETLMERDLADLRGVTKSEDFLSWIEKVMIAELTADFWAVTLPNRLDTSSPNSPLLYAYNASLNLLDARALFSKKHMRDVLDPSVKSTKSAVERHHLFPKSYLGSLGFKSIRETNQIANFAMVEWNVNIAISDTPPSEYFEEYFKLLSSNERITQSYCHALPEGWQNMKYPEFLEARRKGIARVILEGFKRLTHGDTIVAEEETFEMRISRGEGMTTEFKSTLRLNLHTGLKDPKMEHAVLKTLAAFLNSKGGTLFVGVDDAGHVIGLDQDEFANEDKMMLHLDNLIKNQLGSAVYACIKTAFDGSNGKRFLAVECNASSKPVFLKNSSGEEFYMRTGASSAALPASHMHEYIQQRFN